MLLYMATQELAPRARRREVEGRRVGVGRAAAGGEPPRSGPPSPVGVRGGEADAARGDPPPGVRGRPPLQGVGSIVRVLRSASLARNRVCVLHVLGLGGWSVCFIGFSYFSSG